MRLAALQPHWDRGQRWFGGRSQRERLLLTALAGVALVALLLVAIVRPLAAERARATASLRTYDMLAMRLRAAGPGLGVAHSQGSPAAIVSQAAAAAGLTVERIEPEGGRLRVSFADARYEAVLRWVAEIERTSRLRISEARIARSTNGAGGVSCQFLLAG